MSENKNYFSITGKIYDVLPMQTITDTFRKRVVVLELKKDVNGKVYTELVPFECVNERADNLSTYNVGDTVEIGFALTGREYQKEGEGKKYFGSLRALFMQLQQKRDATAEQTSGNEVNDVIDSAVGGNDDLPF